MNSATFPYKLWYLINNPLDNGIKWSREGDMVVIDKKLFNKKCLNGKKFKTSKFLSITKQLNVYGFIQQPHKHTKKFLIYKHDNFKKNYPELLQQFFRRVKKKSNSPTGSTTTDISIHDDTPKFPYKKTKKLDSLEKARLQFKLVLRDNVEKILQLPLEVSNDENDDSDSSIEIIYSKRNRGFTNLPPRKDPRFLMWNGSSSCQQVPSIQGFSNYPPPNRNKSLEYQYEHNPSSSKPVFPTHPRSRSSMMKLPTESEEKTFLNFMPDHEELEEILLDNEIKVVYENVIALEP